MAILAIGSVSACGKKDTTPTEVLKAFVGALQTRDAAALKRTMSKKMLSNLEEQAKRAKKPFDEFLVNAGPPPTMPEIRNEKIAGDKATLEIKYPELDFWKELKFLKEDGAWKLDSD